MHTHLFLPSPSPSIPLPLPHPSCCRLQTILSTHGIPTQTPQQVEPVKIYPPSELIKVRVGRERGWEEWAGEGWEG